MIVGAALTAPLAYRWKTQINENAKLPAFWGELPELDHNEIAGWGGAAGLAPFSAIFLDDCDTHPRLRARIDLTAKEVAPLSRLHRDLDHRRDQRARACLLAGPAR